MLVGSADGDEASFVDRVFWVVECDREPVEEDRDGLSKRHPVFLQVGRRLPGIPFVDHRPILRLFRVRVHSVGFVIKLSPPRGFSVEGWRRASPSATWALAVPDADRPVNGRRQRSTAIAAVSLRAAFAQPDGKGSCQSEVTARQGSLASGCPTPSIASTRTRAGNWAGSGCFPAGRSPPIHALAWCAAITSPNPSSRRPSTPQP